MQVLGGGFQITVPEQDLDGAQVGAGLQQVSRPTVAQRMRGDAFADASPTRGIATCNPHGFVGNRLIEAVLAGAGGGQVEPRLGRTPVLARGLQWGWAAGPIRNLAALGLAPADAPC